MRLHRARTLMAGSSAMPLRVIAAECGFSDASHLVRTYRDHFGYTPRASV
jgi:AraC family transcriptional regulator